MEAWRSCRPSSPREHLARLGGFGPREPVQVALRIQVYRRLVLKLGIPWPTKDAMEAHMGLGRHKVSRLEQVPCACAV